MVNACTGHHQTSRNYIMGRKSALTDKQWDEIGKALLEGISGRSLAAKYGISEAAIRKKFGAQVNQIKAVANQLVAAETSFRALPISAQIGARTLADRLISISTHLASAAEYGAATAHRLAGIAHDKSAEVDPSKPLDEAGREVMKDIMAITRTANEAAATGLNLMNANKDAASKLSEDEQSEKRRTLADFYAGSNA